MAIIVPAVGDQATAAWADSVANQLNTPLLVGTVTTANTATSTGATEALHANLILAVSGIVSGQRYMVEFAGRMATSVAADVDIVCVRALQGTVTTSSPQIAISQFSVAATSGIDYSYRRSWTPGASGAWNLQIGVRRAAGTGNASFGPGANATAELSLYAA
jgi:hypothetical protein